jgi:hypothetical protein
LKDKAFWTFSDQNPPFEPRQKWDFAFDKSPSGPMAIIDNSAIKRLAGKLPSHR